MKIEVSSQAQKFLMKQTENSQIRIREKVRLLKQYCEKTGTLPINSMDIRFLKGKWYPSKRLRIGKIRVIFDIDFNNSILKIEAIDNRGDIY